MASIDSKNSQGGQTPKVREDESGRPLRRPRAGAISIDCGGGVGSGQSLNQSSSINQEFKKLGYSRGAEYSQGISRKPAGKN